MGTVPGAGRATSFAFLIPIFGVLSSVLMLGEPLSPFTVAGGALVLAGLWLVQRRPYDAAVPGEHGRVDARPQRAEPLRARPGSE